MVKIGIVGIFRGIGFYTNACNCKIVAICDKNEELVAKIKKEINDKDVTFYSDFDEFIKHDMDGVVLANYATEHAPYAIKAMENGKHVLSEVLPCQTLKEAVELIECVEKTKMIYAYAENYCYFASTRKMKELYRKGIIGEFEYGEGEYIHNCEFIWPALTCGDKHHWRNNQYATFYCTHSIGPLIHITGLRPKSVVGFELPYTDRTARMGAKCGTAGIEMITLENGAIIKSIHGYLNENSIWYSIYGSKGHMETNREIEDGVSKDVLYINADSQEGINDGKYQEMNLESFNGKVRHEGSDYYPINNFADKIEGKDVDIIDLYEALDMFLPGLMAYRSILKGGIPVKIPDLRKKEERDKYRNDTMCTDKNVANEQYIYSYSKGKIEVPEEVYEIIKEKYEKQK